VILNRPLPRLVPARILKRGDVVMLPADYGFNDTNRGPHIVEAITPNYLTLKVLFEPWPITLWSAVMVVELLERPDAR
jgi:hypothetical protein